jgi:hypothetical protein
MSDVNSFDVLQQRADLLTSLAGRPPIKDWKQVVKLLYDAGQLPKNIGCFIIPANWVQLLCMYPEFAQNGGVPECKPPWHQLHCLHWRELLLQQPHLAQYNPSWRGMPTSCWLMLLQAHPQLAQYCKKWEQFDDAQWYEILRAQPKLHTKMPPGTKLTKPYRDELQRLYPHIPWPFKPKR